MKTLTLSKRLNDILNAEKKQLVSIILDNYRLTKPNFNEFNEICELWSWGLNDLHAELNDLINDQFADIARQLNNLK
jgi:hypothetical protein